MLERYTETFLYVGEDGKASPSVPVNGVNRMTVVFASIMFILSLVMYFISGIFIVLKYDCL